MPNLNTILARVASLFTVDANYLPLKLRNTYIPPPPIDGSALGGVKAGTGVVIASDGTISATGSTPSTVTVTATWASGGTSKDQYLSPGVVNAQGITVNLVTSGTAITNVTTISVGGTPLTGPFTVTGSAPSYSVVVASANVPVAVQVSGGAVAVTGMLAGSVSFSGTGTNLTTVAPIPFSVTTTASFLNASYPFYTTRARIQITGSTIGTSTGSALTLSDGGSSEPVSNFLNFISVNSYAFVTTTYSGTVTGNGTHGAPTNVTININQTVVAPTTYVPAFYAQTADGTVPTFTSASLQTAGAATGSTITYATATASTQYNWICTQRPLANLFISTIFGNTQLVPDVTAPNQTIGGQVFNVYGVTKLGVGTAMQLVIT